MTREVFRVILSVKNLGKKRIDSNSWLFKGVNFQVREGEILYVQGASGTGKSTLLRILGRLETSDAGDICYFDANRRQPIGRQLVPYLRQKPVFWGHSVEKHLKETFSFRSSAHLSYERQSVCSLLNRLGFDGNDLVKRCPSDLSGGEAQVIALTRAVIHAPKILLLDEPDNALDPMRKKLFRRYIESWVQEEDTRAVLWISHDEFLPQGSTNLILPGA